MSDLTKINSTHLSRLAYVYLRQSSAAQVERNRESTARQYALVTKAAELGWPAQQVLVIDEDLGVSGSGVIERSGFARLTAEVALGHVGIVLGLEVSRLARNNADWYRLLDLCGLTDTLIGDADGIYHPAMFNDRLVLGLKGTMSEAELHILRARLLGGIRNKAARGELRRGLPVGFVWGEEDGEIRLHPDAAVASAIRTIFARFAELGSVRRVWLWLRSEGLTFPMQTHYGAAIRWIDPSYTAIYHVLTNPVYAGAYVYGKSRRQITLDATGRRKRQIRKLPRSEWSVLIPEHHTGFIDWATYEANRSRIAANAHPQPHHSGGAVREGSALLQGLATCGACGRRLRTHYTGRTASPGYHCAGKNIVDGRGIFCLSLGAVQIDDAVARAVLTALAPAGLEAALAAAERLEADRDDALAQCRLAAERARYEAQRAERRYRAVDAENRLVARGLESEWEQRLRELEQAKAELARRERERPRALSAEDRCRLLALGADLQSVWEASTTTARDRKELLRTLLVARRSGWENSDNQDGNPGSRCWHDCHSATVAQGGLRICIVAARRSGIGRGCRVDRRPAAASLAFERDATAVALDVHLEDGGMMNQAVDDRDRHCLVREDLAPFAEGLVGGDEEGSPLVAGADELKEHAGFGLVFGDVGDVIEDQQMEFVELGDSGFESELAAGNLQPLDKIGGSGEQHAPAVFDESQAESCRKVALAAARWPKQ